MLERGVLLVSALIWIPYGMYCFLQPGSLVENAGVAATTPTGTTEIRAMYGGLQMAIGALAASALFRPRLVSGTLLTLVFLAGGLAAARALGVVLDGGFSSYTAGGLGFEIATASLALVALSRGRPGAGGT